MFIFRNLGEIPKSQKKKNLSRLAENSLEILQDCGEGPIGKLQNVIHATVKEATSG